MITTPPSPSNLMNAVWAKADPGLRAALNSLHGDPSVELPVMIVLVSPGGGSSEATADSGTVAGMSDEERRAKVRAEQEGFEREAGPVVAALSASGARDVQLFWLNRTIAARAKLPALAAVARLDQVGELVLDARQRVVT